jgi:hypothetical protein
MADTSLIFNIIARDSGVGRAIDGIASKFRGAGAAAEEALKNASSGTDNLDRQIDEAKARVRALAEEFERTGDKSLFSKISRDRSLISQLSKIRAELKGTGNDSSNTGSWVSRLASIFSNAGGSVSTFASGLMNAGSSAMSAVSSISGLVVMALQFAAFQVVAAPALYAFGGAAAALPGMLSGAIAAIATLKLGMSGLSENWAAMNAPASGGGGGGGGGAPAVDMTPKIRAVEAAQRDVTKTARDMRDAQIELASAQAAVSKAHEVARERLSDLNREYRQAKLDQASATDGLVEAEQQLRLAQGRGNPDEIAKAQRAVEQQRLAVEEAADKTDDLGKEYTDASRKGVNGSDEVVAARKQEQDAQRRVRDSAEAHRLAIQRLGDAQADLKRKMDGATAAGGGMRQELPRIADSAQEFLNKLKELKPAFDRLRLDIQQRLFQGLADKLQILADRWLPALHVGLGGMADMMNGVVKTAFDSLSRTDFIDNMMTGLKHFTGMLGQVGQAIAGPLIDAWGRLVRASAPIMDIIGEKLSGIITRFADWIARMDDSGQLDSFMGKAAHIIGTVFDMLEDLGRIAGSVISILFGTDLGSTDSWDNLANILDRVADFLGNPANQAKISEFVNTFGGFAFTIGTFLLKMDEIPGRVNTAIAWFKALPDRVGTFMSRLPGVIQRFAISAINTLGYWIGYGVGRAVRTFINFPGNVYRAITSLPRVFSNIGTWLVNAVSWLGGSMSNVGRSIVTGIWNGIVSLASWLSGSVWNFARSILRGFQDALGIGSPSRRAAREIGHWIPAGIAEGMIRNRGVVVRDAIGSISDELARTRLAVPTMGMDTAMATAAGTLTVAARRQRVEVVSVLDVRGQDGAFKKLIRGMARTDNLYQDKG